MLLSLLLVPLLPPDAPAVVEVIPTAGMSSRPEAQLQVAASPRPQVATTQPQLQPLEPEPAGEGGVGGCRGCCGAGGCVSWTRHCKKPQVVTAQMPLEPAGEVLLRCVVGLNGWGWGLGRRAVSAEQGCRTSICNTHTVVG